MQSHQEKFPSIETFFQVDNFNQKNLQFPLLDNENSLDLVLDNCENHIDFFSQCPKDEETSQIRQIQEASVSSGSQRKIKKQGCHCKKTRCLKMYCECFSQGNICSKDCVCIGCHNDQKHHKSKYTKPQPQQKAEPATRISDLTSTITTSLNKGCNCKKSHCQKRYCQCLNSGRKCSQQCQCIECNNCLFPFEHRQKSGSSSLIEQKNEQPQEQEKQTEQIIKYFTESVKRQQKSYIVMSNQLLAEIDGYITG